VSVDFIHPDLRSLALSIESLNEDPTNANKHGERNLASIAESFKRFGQRKPIVVRREGMVIEAGNGTLRALREAGWTHLACVVCDDDEQTAMAYGLVDNQTARLAEWDFDNLRTNIDALLGEGYDVSGLGWSGDELTDILAGKSETLDDGLDDSDPSTPEKSDAPPSSDDPKDDAIPDPPAEPITKHGEIIEIGPHVLHCCDCMDLLRSLPDNSIDAIVTDPPYGLSPDGRARTWDEIEELRREGKGPKSGFMGNAWDAGVPGITWARECLRVLKPGGHMIAHSATRTVHRLACAVEDAGFEIRDQIGWLHWQGFPKSLDVSKAIDAMHGVEREVVGTRPQRANSPESAIAFNNAAGDVELLTAPATEDAKTWDGWSTALKPALEPAVFARKPLSEPTVAANVLRWGTGALNIDACRYAFGDPAWPGPANNEGLRGQVLTTSRLASEHTVSLPPTTMSFFDERGRWPANIYACPKPATSEREAGLPEAGYGGRGKTAANSHPTVKPSKLYRWLMRLVTPPGGTVLEPFGGSGTTLVAASKEGFRVIAAEMNPAYCDIIRARVEHALQKGAQ
jgi:site-specific DNA-methyltransferase (adenine-specific)